MTKRERIRRYKIALEIIESQHGKAARRKVERFFAAV